MQVFGLGVYGVDIDADAGGPRPRGTRTAPPRCRSSSSPSASASTSPGATAATPRCPRSPSCRSSPRSSASRPTGGRCCRRVEPAGIAARPRPGRQPQLVLHPVGTLQVSQRAVPLDLTARQGRQPAAGRRQPVRPVGQLAGPGQDRGPARAVRPGAVQDHWTTRPNCPSPAYVPLDSGIELAGGRRPVRVRHRDRPDRALRRDDHRHRACAAHPTGSPATRGSLFQSGLRGNAAARSRCLGLRQAQTHPFDGAVAVSAETFAVARHSDNTVYHPDAAAFTSQAAAARLPRPAGRRRPGPGRHAARAAAVRGGRMRPARHLLVPAVAAPGHRQHDHRARTGSHRAHAGQHARRADPRRRPGRRRRRADSRRCRQNFALYGPGDVVGIDARAIIRTDPATGSPTSKPITCAAVDFYDEDFPWRYTPAAPDASGLHLRPVDHPDRAGRERVRAEGKRRHPGRRHHHYGRVGVPAAPTSCGPGRTFTSTTC